MPKSSRSDGVHINELPRFTKTADEDGVVITDAQALLGTRVAGTWIKMVDPNGRVKFMHMKHGTIVDHHQMKDWARRARRMHNMRN